MHLKIQFDAGASAGGGCEGVGESGYKVGRGEQSFPSVPHIIYHHSIHRLPIKGAEHMLLLKPIISDTL